MKVRWTSVCVRERVAEADWERKGEAERVRDAKLQWQSEAKHRADPSFLPSFLQSINQSLAQVDQELELKLKL